MKNFKIYAAIIALGIVIGSCEKDVSDVNNDINPGLTKELNMTSPGDFHNDVMNEVYLSLENNSSLEEKDRILVSLEKVKSMNMNAFNLSSSEYDSIVNDLGFPNFEEMSNHLDTSMQFMKLNESQITNYSNVSTEVKNDLIDFYYNSLTCNKIQFDSLCDNLRLKYVSWEDLAEKEMINNVIDISAKSYDFWSTSMDDWNNGEIIPFAVHPIVQSDISGAITGGLWGAVSGAIGGAGIGALPGALVGASIGSTLSSAAAGIWYYFR